MHRFCWLQHEASDVANNIFIIQASNMVLKIRQKSVRPSHSKLSWNTVAALACIGETQRGWHPGGPPLRIDIAAKTELMEDYLR